MLASLSKIKEHPSAVFVWRMRRIVLLGGIDQQRRCKVVFVKSNLLTEVVDAVADL